MEKARPYGSIGFDDSRYPWGIAFFVRKRVQIKKGGIITIDLSELTRRLGDKM
jgi:hypothetical protein